MLFFHSEKDEPNPSITPQIASEDKKVSEMISIVVECHHYDSIDPFSKPIVFTCVFILPPPPTHTPFLLFIVCRKHTVARSSKQPCTTAT